MHMGVQLGLTQEFTNLDINIKKQREYYEMSIDLLSQEDNEKLLTFVDGSVLPNAQHCQRFHLTHFQLKENQNGV